MTLLLPWALWFLAGIPVIVVLYLLKLKRRPAVVSTLMFWQRVLEESKRRALFQRLRQWLSLLLHLLIFLLILFALAKPEFDRLGKSGASTVLILDDRARMQVVESGGETRFTKARKLLSAYTSRARDLNQMTVISVRGTPEVVSPFSGNEKELRQAVSRIEPTDAAGDLDGAVRLADQLLASRSGAKRIVLITASEPGELRHTAPLDVITTGTPQDNIAIIRFATRPLPNSPQTSQILLEIENFGSQPASGNAELYFDGNLIDVKPFALKPEERKAQIFSSVPKAIANSRGWLTARLDTKDTLASDNEAYAVIPAHDPARVLLVTKGNWFIEKMLAADDLIKFDILAPDAFQPGMAGNFDAVILDNVLPAPFDLTGAEGNFLFINKTPFVSGSAPLDQPLITDIDTASPLMQMVNLKNVSFLRSGEMRLPEVSGDWRFQTPLRSFEHPLIITGSHKHNGAEQRVAAFAFDIADSDLPLRVAFPLLMSNTLEWLAGKRTDAVSSFQAGSIIELQPNQTIWKEPQTKFLPLPKIDPVQTAGHSWQPLRNGFYLLQSGTADEWIAVNTFSESESNLRQIPAKATPDGTPSHTGTFAIVTARPLWNYLALAAFALFSLEWWLFHRRRTE